MSASIALLPERAVLSVSGPDAKPFLQGLVTCHMDHVTHDRSLYGALLSPQGKFLHDFFVVAQGDGFLLDCARAEHESLASRLLKYKLRAKVTVEENPLSVAALWEEEDSYLLSHLPRTGMTLHDTPAILYRDPRVAALGARAILLGEESLAQLAAAGFTAADAESYQRHRLAHGVPEGYRDLIPEKSFILDYGLDDLNGVDFTKGCYVGQEVTARMKHRGALRKQLYRVQNTEPSPLPSAETPLTANGKTIGEMRSSHGSVGLALIRRDTWEETGCATPVQIDETEVNLHLPRWVRSRSFDAS